MHFDTSKNRNEWHKQFHKQGTIHTAPTD